MRLLSPAEERVLQKVADGWRNYEIANQLGLATSTVRTYLSRIRCRFGYVSDTEAWIKLGFQPKDPALKRKLLRRAE